jgi:cobalamin biosynthesis protein CobT
LLFVSGEMPRGEKPFYASKPSMKQSMTRSTHTSSRLAKASQLGKNLSAVPEAPTLKDIVATVEGGAPSAPKEPEYGSLSNVEVVAKFVTPVVVQGPAVVSNDAPMVASVPKEMQNGLLLNIVPAPLSVAVGKSNVESSSSSDDDSSDSGSDESEESDSGSGSDGSAGSDSSSTTSSSGSRTEKPVKPSFPTGVGTVVVNTAELVDAVCEHTCSGALVVTPQCT